MIRWEIKCLEVYEAHVKHCILDVQPKLGLVYSWAQSYAAFAFRKVVAQLHSKLERKYFKISV